MGAGARDRMCGAIVASGLDLTRLAAMAGAAQQHGSVYLNARATGVLAGLVPTYPLVGQLRATAIGGDVGGEASDHWDVSSPVRMRAAEPERTGEFEIKNIFGYSTSSHGDDEGDNWGIKLSYIFSLDAPSFGG